MFCLRHVFHSRVWDTGVNHLASLLQCAAYLHPSVTHDWSPLCLQDCFLIPPFRYGQISTSTLWSFCDSNLAHELVSEDKMRSIPRRLKSWLITTQLLSKLPSFSQPSCATSGTNPNSQKFRQSFVLLLRFPGSTFGREKGIEVYFRSLSYTQASKAPPCRRTLI